MGERPRHQDKDIEALCQEMEDRGWRITPKRKYWSARCSCPEQHKTMIHQTPDRHYVNHKRQWLRNHTCWEEGA